MALLGKSSKPAKAPKAPKPAKAAAPAKVSKPAGAVVGIDIGSQLIKIVEAKAGKTGVNLTGLAIAPTPEGVIENGVITNPIALGAVIKKLLADNGIKGKQCVSAVSGQSSVVVRIIEVPKMTRDELAETMKWEVERQVPFSPTEVVMDFQPLERPEQPPDAQNMEVLLAVAQQDMINNHVETLMAAGLKPMAIDVEPLASGRALMDITGNGEARQTAAILDIGSIDTDLGIFESGLLTFPSPPLPLAGVNLTRAIADSLNETEEQSERLKKELGKVDLEHMGSVGQDASIPQQDDDISGLGTIAFGTDSPFGSPAEPQDQEISQPDQPAVDPVSISPWEIGDTTPGASAFTDTIDGPVFDLGVDDTPAQPATPVFDLSDEPEPPAAEPLAGSGFAEPLDLGAEDSDTASAGDLREKVRDAMAPVLVDIATELRRSLDYYRTRYSRQPEVIYLSGGTARLPNLDKFLANELGIPVVVANPIANLTVTSQRYSTAYLNEVSPLFTVSIGLAIRDML